MDLAFLAPAFGAGFAAGFLAAGFFAAGFAAFLAVFLLPKILFKIDISTLHARFGLLAEHLHDNSIYGKQQGQNRTTLGEDPLEERLLLGLLGLSSDLLFPHLGQSLMDFLHAVFKVVNAARYVGQLSRHFAPPMGPFGEIVNVCHVSILSYYAIRIKVGTSCVGCAGLDPLIDVV